MATSFDEPTVQKTKCKEIRADRLKRRFGHTFVGNGLQADGQRDMVACLPATLLPYPPLSTTASIPQANPWAQERLCLSFGMQRG